MQVSRFEVRVMVGRGGDPFLGGSLRSLPESRLPCVLSSDLYTQMGLARGWELRGLSLSRPRGQPDALLALPGHSPAGPTLIYQKGDPGLGWPPSSRPLLPLHVSLSFPPDTRRDDSCQS